jgi:prepilin-type N-terminal cleavage/methylation domain-containing protein
MIGNRKGFSLVELMITMVVFVFVIAAGSQIFTGLLTQFKQQSKIGETDIEGAVGLDLLRYDLAQVGYGLPWNLSTAACGGSCDPCAWNCMPNYTEAAADATSTIADPASFNDAGSGAPRAIISGCSGFNNSCGASNGQSYLVIKSAVAATNDAAGKWTNLKSGDVKTTWNPTTQNVNVKNDGTTNNNVRVIVLALGQSAANRETLVTDGSNWNTTYSNTLGFAPTDTAETRVIYGIDPNNTALRMPFNRTDYFISRPSDIPARCAPNTGVLYKTTVNQSDGRLLRLPLLDCVAYMHVDYMLDTNVDGTVETISDDIMTGIQPDAADCPDGNAACKIRNELKEVRVYIIAQEGQRDATYDFSNGGTRTNFTIPSEGVGSITRGPVYFPYASGNYGTPGSLSTLIGNPEYKYYRWKLYTLIVQPNNLR